MIPNKIIATRTIYQPIDTMLWTDDINNINIEDCNNYLEPANVCVLNEVREFNNRTLIDYYEKDNSGNTESIIEISLANLQFLIEFNIINVIE